MNTSTGYIDTADNLIKGGTSEEDLMPIRTANMTKKQQREQRVRLNDNRSLLGKQRVEYTRLTANQKKRMRKRMLAAS